VILATGFGMKLTEKLGLGKTEDFVIGAQATVETRGGEGRKFIPGRRWPGLLRLAGACEP